jgi:hypothetical protein
MVIRIAFALLVCVPVLSGASALAWPSTRTPTQFPPKQRVVKPPTPIRALGCIQPESDYRREHDRGRGGFVGTGWGLGNEYVLIPDCTSPEGTAYELTGRHEGHAAQFVGRRVAMTGMLKDAKTKLTRVGTSDRYTSRPTGGFDPLNQDLRLYEVDVTSLTELAPPPIRRRSIQAQPADTAPITTAQLEEPSSGPSDQARRAFDADLPRTTSGLPRAALLGLLALGGALGMRALRH